MKPNLICVLPGSSDATVIVSAHYDKVDTGGSQGAIDNWSSASLLPGLYEALSGKPRRLTMEFIGFTDEEKGLVGSRFFVKLRSPEDRGRIVAVVNLDSIGMTSTRVLTSRANRELINDIGLVAGTSKLPVGAVNVDLVGDADSHPFGNCA